MNRSTRLLVCFTSLILGALVCFAQTPPVPLAVNPPPTTPLTNTVTLVWDPSPSFMTNSNGFYTVWCGPSSGSYTTNWTTKSTMLTLNVDWLDVGTNYFSVTFALYDGTNAIFSVPSNEVWVKVIPSTKIKIQVPVMTSTNLVGWTGATIEAELAATTPQMFLRQSGPIKLTAETSDVLDIQQ